MKNTIEYKGKEYIITLEPFGTKGSVQFLIRAKSKALIVKSDEFNYYHLDKSKVFRMPEREYNELCQNVLEAYEKYVTRREGKTLDEAYQGALKTSNNILIELAVLVSVVIIVLTCILFTLQG